MDSVAASTEIAVYWNPSTPGFLQSISLIFDFLGLENFLNLPKCDLNVVIGLTFCLK